MGKSYRPKDHYFQKAKRQGFRARSAFKIEEIADRFGVLGRGAHVLDLGAAPGGFLQVIADAVGPEGRVTGVDVVEIRPLGLPNVQTAPLDVLADDFDARLALLDPGPFDVVVSDLAPRTTGIKSTDQARSIRLATRALEIARQRGREGSSFIAKLFMGGEFEAFRDEVRRSYAEVKVVRPEATRGGSAEVYLVGLRKKAA
jgi:23S rRNA (uridine2552-2'-O)-methyltransferase